MLQSQVATVPYRRRNGWSGLDGGSGTRGRYCGCCAHRSCRGGHTGLPHFYNGNVESIRDAGSDTTFFMMQQIGDVYTSAGLYGCTLNNSDGETLFNSSDPASTSTNYESFCAKNLNVATTDAVDNWDRTEVYQGVDNVGSSAGQAELCNEADGSAVAATPPFSVDFARSSKPSDDLSGCAEQQIGYAKDGVPVVDFPNIVPGDIGASTFSTYQNVNGGSGKVGPVAAGWLPGDPLDGPYSGTAFSDVDNTVGGVVSQSSVAYNLWCNTGTGKISDWGQLTNLGPSVVLDQVTTSTSSASISLPAGETFASSIGSGDTLSSTNVTGVSGLTVVSNNGTTLTLSGDPGTTTTHRHHHRQHGDHRQCGQWPGHRRADSHRRAEHVIRDRGDLPEVRQLRSDQLGRLQLPTPIRMPPSIPTRPRPPVTTPATSIFWRTTLPTLVPTMRRTSRRGRPWTADAAILDASSLYYMANGVLNTNPFASAIVVNGTSYAANKMTENGHRSICRDRRATTRSRRPARCSTSSVRTRSGLLRPDSTTGCVTATRPSRRAGTRARERLRLGLTNIIVNDFGFTRLTDFTSATPATNPAGWSGCAEQHL